MGKHICAERLTLPIIAATAIGPRHVTYHVSSQSWAARHALGLLRRWLPSKAPDVAQFTPNLNDARIFGRNLMYRIEGTLLHLAERLSEDWADMPLPASEMPYRREWLQILCANLVHLGRQSVEFIASAEHAASMGRFGPPGSGAVLVYFPAPILGSFISKNYPLAVNGLTLRASRTRRGLVDLVRIVPGHPRRWLGLIFGKRTPPDFHAVSEEAIAAGTVFEQAYSQSLRHFPTLGHLAWANTESVDRRRVVLYFDRSDTPPSPGYTNQAQALGFSWANLEFPINFLQHPLFSMVRVLFDCTKLFPRQPSELHLWRWATVVRHLMLHRGHMAAVTRFNVKLLHQAVEFPGDTLSLALAVRKNNGLFLWNFWSFLGDPPARYYTGWADLCFAWGAHDEAFYYHIGLRQRAVIKTGILSSGGAPDQDMIDRSAALRARFPNNAKVIAVYDTSFGLELHSSREHLIVFYKTILSAMTEHANLCLLVKPKGTNLARLNEPDVESGLRKFEAQGRCLILDGGEQPQLAALASDLVVAIPVGTSGITAAALGRRALHLDLSGMNFHPFHELDCNRQVIINTVDAFRSAIDAILDGSDQYGDHAPMIRILDSFGDGLGRVRMGQVIAWLLEAFERGASPDEAVEQALERYRGSWGTDSVSTRPAEASPILMSLWRECFSKIVATAQPPAWMRLVQSGDIGHDP